jgi:hypothetical protein
LALHGGGSKNLNLAQVTKKVPKTKNKIASRQQQVYYQARILSKVKLRATRKDKRAMT